MLPTELRDVPDRAVHFELDGTWNIRGFDESPDDRDGESVQRRWRLTPAGEE